MNIAQKFSGYIDAAGTTPDTKYFIGRQRGKAPGLQQAMDYVDGADRAHARRARRQWPDDSTVVIMAAKHGNSPVDRTTFTPIDPDTTFKPLIDGALGTGLTARSPPTRWRSSG